MKPANLAQGVVSEEKHRADKARPRCPMTACKASEEDYN